MEAEEEKTIHVFFFVGGEDGIGFLKNKGHYKVCVIASSRGALAFDDRSRLVFVPCSVTSAKILQIFLYILEKTHVETQIDTRNKKMGNGEMWGEEHLFFKKAEPCRTTRSIECLLW